MMKASVDAKTLGKMFESFAFTKNSPLPLPLQFTIASGFIKIEGENGAIRLSRKVDVIGSGDSESETFGMAPGVIPQTLKSLQGNVDVMISGDKFVVIQGTRKYSVTGTHEVEPMAFGKAKGIKVAGSTLFRGIGKTIDFVSSDSSRPALVGVLVQSTETGLSFAGTSGHLLSKYDVILKDPVKKFKAVIPADSLDLLLSLPMGETYTIYQYEGLIGFRSDDMALESSIIEDEFPNIKPIVIDMIADNANEVVMAKSKLRDLIKICTLYSPSQRTSMMFGVTPDKIEARAEDVDFGAYCRQWINEPNEGLAIKLLLNVDGKLLSTLLNVIETDTVLLKFGDTSAGKPIVMLPTQKIEGEELLTLAMPLRIDDYGREYANWFDEEWQPDSKKEVAEAA
jgi:DNA polymerase III sliding clamp (beta) subunit (PCNA family)